MERMPAYGFIFCFVFVRWSICSLEYLKFDELLAHISFWQKLDDKWAVSKHPPIAPFHCEWLMFCFYLLPALILISHGGQRKKKKEKQKIAVNREKELNNEVCRQAHWQCANDITFENEFFLMHFSYCCHRYLKSNHTVFSLFLLHFNVIRYKPLAVAWIISQSLMCRQTHQIEDKNRKKCRRHWVGIFCGFMFRNKRNLLLFGLTCELLKKK